MEMIENLNAMGFDLDITELSEFTKGVINRVHICKAMMKHGYINSVEEGFKKYVGDDVHLRALIEFSNICKNNCLYCGIRAENSCINRYKLTSNEIIKTANKKINIIPIPMNSGARFSALKTNAVDAVFHNSQFKFDNKECTLIFPLTIPC